MPHMSIKTRACVLKALCSLLKRIIEWRDDGHSGQKRRGKLQSTSCAGKYDTVSTGTNTAAAIITTEKKHGKFGRAADHHEALCLAMCKYEIIILLKMSHHSMSLFQANKCFYSRPSDPRAR